MKMFVVYSNGDFEEEFKTYEEAKNYVKNLIKGTASTYKKTQKEARAILGLTIEEVEYV
jgi:hypothetical protein